MRLRSFLIALTVLAMASVAKAQQTKVKANIPFDFYAGDRNYPAGEYAVSSITSNNSILRIDGNPEVSGTNLPSNACSLSRPSSQTKLVFHRMGGNYFLYQVWIEGNLDGRQFPMSRTEIRLAQNDKMSTVIVAANKK